VKAFARINTLPAALLKHAPSHLHRLHWRRPDAARSTTSTPLANTNQPPGPTTMVTPAQGLFLRDKKNDKSENRVSRLGAVFYFITEKSFKPTNTTSSPFINLNIIPFLCIAFMLGCWETI
jgi:hypothetical protein